MDKLKWCLKQKKGLKIIEEKPHLSEAYMKEADDTLENVFYAKGKWKVITAYYACYNALYSTLMMSGIKSEIHECSIEIMHLLGFSKKEMEYIKKLKKDRINAQYYLKKIVLDDEEEVKRFVLRCKTILETLNSEKIENLREKIRRAIR